jgi:hypothetical protein
MKIFFDLFFHAVVIIPIYEKLRQIITKLKQNKNGQQPKQSISIDLLMLAIIIAGCTWYYWHNYKPC